MISLHYTSHTKAYNTIYTACNIVEAIYSFTKLIADNAAINVECKI